MTLNGDKLTLDGLWLRNTGPRVIIWDAYFPPEFGLPEGKTHQFPIVARTGETVKVELTYSGTLTPWRSLITLLLVETERGERVVTAASITNLPYSSKPFQTDEITRSISKARKLFSHVPQSWE